MGRNAQPVDVLKANGKKHLTKAEIKQRQGAEIEFGSSILDYKKVECPGFVKNDLIAYAKWDELLREYRKAAKEGNELIKTSDLGILARYCKTFSEYESLLKRKERIDNIDYPDSREVEEEIGEDETQALFKKINYIISTDGILKIETAINKKQDMLIKMEDRLFLNALAKIKNIPKKAPEKPEPNKFAKFTG